MARKKYIYQGPPSGVTLRIGEGKKAEVLEAMFFDGHVVELPPDHPYVKRLTAQGRLKEHVIVEEKPKAEALKNVNKQGNKAENG